MKTMTLAKERNRKEEPWHKNCYTSQARKNQYHFLRWQDTRLEDQSNDVGTILQQSRACGKRPLLFCNNTFPMLSSDLHLIHYLLFLNRSISLSSVDNSLPPFFQGNHKWLDRRPSSLPALTLLSRVLYFVQLPLNSSIQLFYWLLKLATTPKWSPVSKIHTSSFHTRQLWAFNPGSNHLGDAGLLRGRTQIQSGKHFS